MKQHVSAFATKNNDIYAPFYKQASIRMYHEWISNNFDRNASEKAFDAAYSDVKEAFYYFKRFRKKKSRGFILAGHSQVSFVCERN